MNPGIMKLLKFKKYDAVIQPYQDLVCKFSFSNIQFFIQELKDIFEYMLQNDPLSEYTAIAAGNLRMMSINFGTEFSPLSKLYLENTVFAGTNDLTRYSQNFLNEPILSKAIFFQPEDIIPAFTNLIKHFRPAKNDYNAISFTNYDCLIATGNYYIAGALSEKLRNHIISIQEINKKMEYFIPFSIFSNYFITCILAIFPKSLQIRYDYFFHKKLFSDKIRISSIISKIYGIFLSGDRIQAKKYFKMLFRYNTSNRDRIFEPFEFFDSIINPTIYNKPSHNDMLMIRHSLSLAQELIWNGDGHEALSVLSLLKIDKKPFNNAIFYALNAEYWAIKADAYQLLDMPNEQKEAQQKWLSFWSRSDRFQKKVVNFLYKRLIFL